MAKFALPIKSTYVPDWGVWECLREFIQNAKDEEEDRGSSMEITHRGTKLRVFNQGADMDRSVLLLGKTSKAHRGDLRGQFGEGLNLALLAGVRAGLSIVIYTQTERWTPSIEACPEFGDEDCLVIKSRKLPNRRNGVEVEISGVDKGAWEELRKMFIFLSDIPDNRIVRVQGKGALLLEEERKGCVYAKGVFVSRLSKFDHGYDLDHLPLDRDRRMVNVWEVQWAIGELFQDALSSRPELLKADVYRMLRDGAEDVANMSYHAGSGVRDVIVDEFVSEHGEEAVPVASIQESQSVGRAGKKGIVVPEQLRKILQAKMGSPEEIVQDALSRVTTLHAWSDLTVEERGNLTVASAALDEVLTDREAILSRVEIVDFGDGNLHGTCDLVTGRIRLARSALNSVPMCLRVLVHEEAHAISEAGDGTESHQTVIEELWTLLWDVSRSRGQNS